MDKITSPLVQVIYSKHSFDTISLNSAPRDDLNTFSYDSMSPKSRQSPAKLVASVGRGAAENCGKKKIGLVQRGQNALQRKPHVKTTLHAGTREE